MEHRKHAGHASQVIVIVTIVGIDDHAQVFYTYTDDEANLVHVEDASSSVFAVTPYQTLYALDYATTRNGWIVGDKPVPTPPGSPVPTVTHDDGRLWVITHHDEPIHYRFSLHFRNHLTGKEVWDDPQEANVKQPR